MKILIYISIFLLFALYGMTGSVSSSVMYVFIALVGICLCQTFEKCHRKNAFTIYFSIFAIITLLILLRYGYLTDMPDSSNIFKTGGDEHEHYEYTEAAKGFSSIGKMFADTFFLEFIENQGYVFYIRLLSYMGCKFFDGNHIVLQMEGSGLIGCILSIMLYKIFIIYFKKQDAYKYTMFSFLLSPFLYYSIELLRDLHMALLYSIIIYIVLKPYHLKGLLWLVFLLVPTFFVRMENGIFAFVFIAYYVYNARQINMRWLIIPFMIFVVYLVNTSFFSEMYEIVDSTNEYYINRSNEMDNSAILSLPHPFREIGVFSMAAFFNAAGSWLELFKCNSLFQVVNTILLITYGCFWTFLFILMFKWIIFDKGWSQLSKPLQLLFLLAVAYELAISSQLEARRAMCIYPIFLVVFFTLWRVMRQRKAYKRELLLTSLYYIAISLLVIIVKA